MNYQPFKVYSLLSVRQLYTVYHLSFEKDYYYPGENHNFWELSVILDGTAGTTSGDKIYTLEKNDMILHRPNVFHTVWANDNRPIEIFTVSFDGVGFDSTIPSGKFALDENERYVTSQIIKELPATFKGYDINEYENLISISAPNDVGYQIIKNYIELLCLSIKRKGYESVRSPAQDSKSIRYTNIVTYLKENIEKNLTIEAICRDIYETPGSLKSIFKQFTGCGVIKYYNTLRCEYCMQLISEGYSMKDISDIMNFSSQFYFTYFFKREIGMTPSEYRLNTRKPL